MSTLISKQNAQKKDSGRQKPVKRTNSSGLTNKAKKLKVETNESSQDYEPSTSEVKKKSAKKTVKSKERLSKCVKSSSKKPKKDCKCSETGERSSFKERKPDEVNNKKIKNTKKTEQDDLFCSWKDEDYLAELENVTVSTARNIINLLNEQNTIPFIVRYRSHLTGEIKPDKLRKIRESYEYIQEVHEKARQLNKKLKTLKALTPQLLTCIQSARTLEELDFIGSQFKSGSKRTLAERAREAGLQPAAEAILKGKEVVDLQSLVNSKVPELDDLKKVKLGIQHIIADIISKTAEIHSHLEAIYASKLIVLKSEFKQKNEEDRVNSKYHVYGDFSRPLHSIKPHQTLAISRGESENELSVKVVIPDSLWLPLKNFCKKKWSEVGIQYKIRKSLLNDSVDDAIKRLLAPLAVRRIRARLNSEAENEALCVFGYNLRQLLMTSPVSGRVVMGIDPGFRNGCKVAVVSPTGRLLGYDKFFLNDPVTSRKKLKSLILEFRCEMIALGNGAACRETEALLSKFINRRTFKPLNVSYTIISEQAVSIYSCSPIAAEEFPNLDPTIVGAISLARRLQNPLSELVKVEPRHLGVGMYQHDVKEKKLVCTLDEIVSECVSFVGVDVNSASLYLLKRVAGLTTTKAQEIIKYRTEVCSFKCREDLKKVSGIKTKTFLQCSGFLRIIPSTARCTKHGDSCKSQFNPLDETSIHPESYADAYKIMNLFGVKLDELGSEKFAQTIQSFSFTITELAKYLNCSELVVSFLIDTLKKPKNFDLRTLSPGPIFRSEIKNLDELSPGQNLEGVVRNVVSFGAFVDIGVGVNGLIHTSNMNNTVLHLNSRVNVNVVSVEKSTQKVQLQLIAVVDDNF